MATRINKLEGAKPLLPATGREKPSPSRRDSMEHLPLPWADRDPEETFEAVPFTGWPDEEESLSEDPIQLHHVLEATQSLLKEAFTTHLPNGSRLQVRKPYGLPQNDHSQPPKLDTMVKRRLGRNVKNQDTELSKIQALTLDAVGPLTYLLEVSSAEEAESIPVKKVTEVLRTALTLLGSASAHIFSLRRKKILAELNPDLQDLTEKDNLFKDAAPLLFGEGFEAVAKEYSEGLKALAKAAPNRDFRSHHPGHNQRRGGGHGRTGHYRLYSTPHSRGGFQRKGYFQSKKTEKN